MVHTHIQPQTSDLTAPAAGDAEREVITRQQRIFSVISAFAIGVSFVHMAAALALFSGPAWHELAAALAMTLLVDVATWAIVEYQAYARRRRLRRSRWVGALFGVALVISMTLNGAYLYAHRPAADRLPEWLSLGIALAFAAFVPLLIGVASLARGELEDDRLTLDRAQDVAVQERAELARLRTEHAQLARERDGLRSEVTSLRDGAQAAAQLRADLAHETELRAQVEGQAAQLRAEVAQRDRETAQLRADVAQSEQVAAQERAGRAQLERELAQSRAAAAQVEEERALAAQPGALDVLAIARRLRELGASSREAAQLVGLPESTLRSRLRQAGTHATHAELLLR